MKKVIKVAIGLLSIVLIGVMGFTQATDHLQKRVKKFKARV